MTGIQPERGAQPASGAGPANSIQPMRAAQPAPDAQPATGGWASLARLRGGLVTAWSTGSPGRRATILLGSAITAALAGAFLFGAWHLLFGGFVKGNWRAGAFGVALACGAAVLIAVEAAVVRRSMR